MKVKTVTDDLVRDDLASKLAIDDRRWEKKSTAKGWGATAKGWGDDVIDDYDYEYDRF